MHLIGITFEAEGEPEYLVQCLRQRLREVGATLPLGQRALVLRAKIDHPKPKKSRAKKSR